MFVGVLPSSLLEDLGGSDIVTAMIVLLFIVWYALSASLFIVLFVDNGGCTWRGLAKGL